MFAERIPTVLVTFLQCFASEADQSRFHIPAIDHLQHFHIGLFVPWLQVKLLIRFSALGGQAAQANTLISEGLRCTANRWLQRVVLSTG